MIWKPQSSLNLFLKDSDDSRPRGNFFPINGRGQDRRARDLSIENLNL